MFPADRGALLELLGVYAATVVIAGLFASGALGPFAADHSGELIALLFLAAGMHFGGRIGLERAGLSLGGVMISEPEPSAPAAWDPLGIRDLVGAIGRAIPSALRETAFALAVAAAIFPPFTIGFYLFHRPAHAFDVQALAAFGGPLAWAELVFAQLLVVALPEEAFFRGYVQTRLADARDCRDSRLRAPAVLITQAALFALVHLISIPRLGRLAVFFPALVFGLMRARRGGIGAAVVFHALCNLLSEVLTRGWL